MGIGHRAFSNNYCYETVRIGILLKSGKIEILEQITKL